MIFAPSMAGQVRHLIYAQKTASAEAFGAEPVIKSSI
jgi:hypothetical protein